MNLTQSALAVGYFFFFLLCVLAMLWWQKRQRKTRLPFGDEFRVLRGPGETQLKLSRKFDEEIAMWICFGAGAPALVAGIMLSLTKNIPATFQVVWVVFSAVIFITAFITCARWFASKTRENANRYLGYFGERIVAEHLDALKLQGWRVFHDVPGLANGNAFNIDHIAVGPQGVFAVETKTRRKGNARPGFEEHKVYFDGRVLIWPWGEDNHGLEQAERNAIWLTDTIKADTGERVFVTPILTLPGWWVEQKPGRESRLAKVTNPKTLARFLPAGPAVLNEKQINAIASKLEARCRDVEF
jgi:hypothetical protein